MTLTKPYTSKLSRSKFRPDAATPTGPRAQQNGNNDRNGNGNGKRNKKGSKNSRRKKASQQFQKGQQDRQLKRDRKRQQTQRRQRSEQSRQSLQEEESLQNDLPEQSLPPRGPLSSQQLLQDEGSLQDQQPQQHLPPQQSVQALQSLQPARCQRLLQAALRWLPGAHPIARACWAAAMPLSCTDPQMLLTHWYQDITPEQWFVMDDHFVFIRAKQFFEKLLRDAPARYYSFRDGLVNGIVDMYELADSLLRKRQAARELRAARELEEHAARIEYATPEDIEVNFIVDDGKDYCEHFPHCRNGNRCWKIHLPGIQNVVPFCKAFHWDHENGCRFGPNCMFRHHMSWAAAARTNSAYKHYFYIFENPKDWWQELCRVTANDPSAAKWFELDRNQHEQDLVNHASGPQGTLLRIFDPGYDPIWDPAAAPKPGYLTRPVPKEYAAVKVNAYCTKAIGCNPIDFLSDIPSAQAQGAIDALTKEIWDQEHKDARGRKRKRKCRMRPSKSSEEQFRQAKKQCIGKHVSYAIVSRSVNEIIADSQERGVKRKRESLGYDYEDVSCAKRRCLSNVREDKIRFKYALNQKSSVPKPAHIRVPRVPKPAHLLSRSAETEATTIRQYTESQPEVEALVAATPVKTRARDEEDEDDNEDEQRRDKKVRLDENETFSRLASPVGDQSFEPRALSPTPSPSLGTSRACSMETGPTSHPQSTASTPPATSHDPESTSLKEGVPPPGITPPTPSPTREVAEKKTFPAMPQPPVSARMAMAKYRERLAHFRELHHWGEKEERGRQRALLELMVKKFGVDEPDPTKRAAIYAVLRCGVRE